mmetsp:Transcript_21656/g.35440  ORF Transcript_21656/g.35440 Transcript_21656/m.35440 type:complete len:336 (+) Transcript_21656:103-1110(+)|eukprot:scaffold9546_cov157-Skeletonema_menzelii.AAC.4
MVAASVTTFLCSLVVLVMGETSDNTADSGNLPAHQKVCDSRFLPNGGDTSLYVGGEATAQAYKPNAPIKTSVCDESSSSEYNVHKVAHWSFWRSDYKDSVPIFIKGNLLSCHSGDAAAAIGNEATLEVWQPRPNGTYSSIRPGIEEGDCRASVPITTTTKYYSDNDSNIATDDINRIGTVEFETFAPGSIGILNGLVPSSSRDYLPYKPGAIHMFLNVEGYHPFLRELSLSELNDWIPAKISKGRFKLSGGKSFSSNSDGIEILSVTPKSRPGYELAIEVEINLFLVGNDKEAHGTIGDIFCSHNLQRGRLNWIPLFFKEPISVCSAAYMDFFAL